MENMEGQLFDTLAISKDNGRFIAINMAGEVASQPRKGVRLMIDKKDPFRIAPTSRSRGLVVNVLSLDKILPIPRVRQMKTGPIEQFRAEIGFADPFLGPTSATVAVWTECTAGVPRSHEFLVGGPQLDIEFSTSRFKGLGFFPDGTEDTMVTLSIDPASLKFKTSSNVTEWKRFPESFQDTIATSGMELRWSEGNPMWTRFSIKADQNTNGPEGTLTIA